MRYLLVVYVGIQYPATRVIARIKPTAKTKFIIPLKLLKIQNEFKGER